MTQTELMQFLSKTGIPVSYYAFPGSQPIPCIVFVRVGAEAAGSDVANELKRDRYLVELYSADKYPEGEKLIEDLFDSLGIKYSCYESYLDTEKLYQVAWEIEFYYKKNRSDING